MVEYKLEGERYACYLDGRTVLATGQVVLLVDQDAGILLKHGDLEAVSKKYHVMRNAFAQAGFAELANDLVLVEGPRDIEELNQLLQCTGYLTVYLKKFAAKAAIDATNVLSGFTLRPLPATGAGLS